jgi:hypothetical protein
MTIGIKSSADILNTTVRSGRDVGVKATQLKEAQASLTNPAKYISRADLDRSGLSRKFDELQTILLNIKSQNTAGYNTTTKLNNESKALEQVNDIMVCFEKEMSQSNNIAGSKQNKVDRALEKIENALRTRDSSGKYIWGGTDSFTDPLSKLDNNRNRIAVNLLEDKNIEDGAITKGLITNNFSTVAPDKTMIKLSSEHTVKKSFIYPGHDSIAKTIGYLNKIKENAKAIDEGQGELYPVTELALNQREQLEARGKLKVEIDLEIKKVKQAFEVNDRDAKDAIKENNDLFSANIIERAQAVRDLIVSLTALISISNIDSKVSDALFNLRV